MADAVEAVTGSSEATSSAREASTRRPDQIRSAAIRLIGSDCSLSASRVPRRGQQASWQR